jgi:hypothetical protein
MLLFAAAVAVSGIVLLAWQSHLTFFYDDWDPLLDRRGFSGDAILRPHVDHIIISTTLIYKAIQATFGMESLVPYAVISTSTFLGSVVLLFVYLRRRVGDWLALAGVLPILFLGAAHDDLIWPYQVFFFGAMASGLGALLVLERRDSRGDALACGLLVVSFTFSELALPFVLGAAVALAFDRGALKRAYVVVLPPLFYAAWYAGWGHTAASQLSFQNVINSPAYILDGLAAGVASILGLTESALTTTGGLGWGRPLLVVLLLAVAFRARSNVPIPRPFWVTLTVLLSFWFLTAANTGLGRPPTASRYQYMAAILILLVVADLATGVRLRWPGIAIALGVAAFGALGNISVLHQWYATLAELTPQVRGGLAGLEIAADTASPDLVLDAENSNINYLNAIRAGPYLSAVDAYGSPAYSQAELAGAPENARIAADKVLAAALGLALRPTAESPPSGDQPPVLVAPANGLVAKHDGCVTVHSAGGTSPVVNLPPGGATLTAPEDAPAQLSLRRFSSGSFPIFARTLRGTAILAIPTDRSARPWQLQLAGAGPMTICGRRAE